MPVHWKPLCPWLIQCPVAFCNHPLLPPENSPRLCFPTGIHQKIWFPTRVITQLPLRFFLFCLTSECWDIFSSRSTSLSRWSYQQSWIQDPLYTNDSHICYISRLGPLLQAYLTAYLISPPRCPRFQILHAYNKMVGNFSPKKTCPTLL